LDVPVTKVELSNGINAGIRLNILSNGLIPIFEEHEARLERNISLKSWADMHYMEKALIVADRRIRNATQNIQAEAEIEKMKADAKKGKK
jgi:hypothetical protein